MPTLQPFTSKTKEQESTKVLNQVIQWIAFTQGHIKPEPGRGKKKKQQSNLPKMKHAPTEFLATYWKSESFKEFLLFSHNPNRTQLFNWPYLLGGFAMPHVAGSPSTPIIKCKLWTQIPRHLLSCPLCSVDNESRVFIWAASLNNNIWNEFLPTQFYFIKRKA